MNLTSFEPVRIPMPPKEVSEQEVRAKANEIVSQIPCYDDASEEPAAMEDRVRVRLTMREAGAPLPGLDDAELSLHMGDGFFPAPLIDGMVGMTKGEVRHIAWDAAGLGAQDETDRSASIEADVELLGVSKRVRPPMTDEWVAAHIPHCATVEGFFAQVRDQLQGARDRQWDREKRERCGIALARRLVGGVPSEELRRAREGVRADFDRALAREGKTRAEKAAELGLDETGLDAALDQQGELVARQGIAVRLMADHLGASADDDDVERLLAGSLHGDNAARRLSDDREGRAKLREAARCEKALDWVVQAAIVIERDEEADGVPRGREIPNPFA